MTLTMRIEILDRQRSSSLLVCCSAQEAKSRPTDAGQQEEKAASSIREVTTCSNGGFSASRPGRGLVRRGVLRLWRHQVGLGRGARAAYAKVFDSGVVAEPRGSSFAVQAGAGLVQAPPLAGGRSPSAGAPGGRMLLPGLLWPRHVVAEHPRRLRRTKTEASAAAESLADTPPRFGGSVGFERFRRLLVRESPHRDAPHGRPGPECEYGLSARECIGGDRRARRRRLHARGTRSVRR